MKLVVLVSALALGCAGAYIPPALRGYDILVEGRDSLDAELVRALDEYGVRARRKVRGGSRPTAALISFVFRYPAPDEPTWLHVRLADTRSGVIVRAGSVLLDSTTATTRARARAAVQALMAADSTF